MRAAVQWRVTARPAWEETLLLGLRSCCVRADVGRFWTLGTEGVDSLCVAGCGGHDLNTQTLASLYG